MIRPTTLLFLLSLSLSLQAAEPAPVDGKFPPPKPPEGKWVDLLAGKFEDNWSDMNCTMSGSFKLAADEKGVPVLAGTGRPIGLIRSMRPYENFILEVEWRHLTEAPNAGGGNGTSGNSGLYVWADPIPPLGNCFTRAIEVQVCNLGNGQWYTSHGDLFPIHGAKMIADPRFGISGDRSMPIEFRCRKTGEWNQCRITCVDGAIQQEINGALVTAGFRSSPRKGYLCIESEGGPVEFKNMRLQELAPDPSLKPDQVSIILPEGTRTTCLYNGLNLDGWTTEGPAENWTVNGGTLRCAAKNAPGSLSRPLPAGDFVLLLDWSKDKTAREETAPFSLEGLGLPAAIPGKAIHADDAWNRAELRVKAGKATLVINKTPVVEDQALPAQAQQRFLKLQTMDHSLRLCNIMTMETP